MEYRDRDIRIFKGLVGDLGGPEVLQMSPGRLALEIARSFIGFPYEPGTLETQGAERLLVNLRAFDCFTLVENVVALTGLLRSGDRSFARFGERLRMLRYRGGRLRGYPSRLHYFSEWIYDNTRKGFLRDVTAGIGGKPLRRALNFMTENPGAYPALRDPACRRRMKAVERVISRRPLFVIPREDLRRAEGRIEDGDVIAIATDTEGLDVRHCGLAARVGGRIHLLHASSAAGKVILSRETLYGYVMRSQRRSGIVVARIC